jgi:hypothetical protein
MCVADDNNNNNNNIRIAVRNIHLHSACQQANMGRQALRILSGSNNE